MLCVMFCCCFPELSINKDLCLRVANVWLYGAIRQRHTHNGTSHRSRSPLASLPKVLKLGCGKNGCYCYCYRQTATTGRFCLVLISGSAILP